MNNYDSQPKAVIILAAGKGTRMNSELPKVLHQIHGKPIISILLDTIVSMSFERVLVVIGHKGELVKEELAGYPVQFVWQHEQKGTGHAVQVTKELMDDFNGTTLVMTGDVPFLSEQAIKRLIAFHLEKKAAATCLSAVHADPDKYGRIIRDGDSDVLKEIIEYNDASPEVLAITEVNSGTFCFDNRELFAALEKIDDNNAKKEFYLTDTIKVLHNKGLPVVVVKAENPDEVKGINTVEELEALAEIFRDRR